VTHAKMALHCEKFDEERAERVIKNYVRMKLNVIINMQFLHVRDVLSILPNGFRKCFTPALVFDKLTPKMDPSIVLVVNPLKEKTCWMPLCIKPGNSNKFKF